MWGYKLGESISFDNHVELPAMKVLEQVVLLAAAFTSPFEGFRNIQFVQIGMIFELRADLVF